MRHQSRSPRETPEEEAEIERFPNVLSVISNTEFVISNTENLLCDSLNKILAPTTTNQMQM